MRVRVLGVWFAVALIVFSLAEIAGVQGLESAGAVPLCGSNCFVSPSGSNVNPGTSALPFQTIQFGVNSVTAGGTVNVEAGTYAENVTIPQSVEILGAGATTIVEPAVSNPDCGGAGGGSLCSGASVVFLVQSSNVTIDHLTVNGDNPSISTGYNVGGANIDARDGIIEDYTSGACVTECHDLSVHDVTVKNIYLRAIYASSDGTNTFNFTNNTVDNVQGDPNGSVAMFNFGGSGVMAGNHVSNALDAISANHSTGTQFTNNTITASGSGIHTDNAGDSGGAGDVISGNTVTACTPGGYGVWEFVPYLAPTLSNNTVSGCDTGMAALASCDLGGANGCPAAVIPTAVFTHNTVTDTSGGIGFYATTNSFGFGDGEVHASADHNTITGPGTGVLVEEDQTANVAHAAVSVNRNALASFDNTGTTTQNGTCNWWGQPGGATGGQTTGSVTKTPWLGSSDLTGPCPATVPGAPVSTAAVPYGSGTAKVIWTAPHANGSPAVTGYVVKPFLGAVAQTVHTFNSTATSQFIGGLQNGKAYQFEIAAKNGNGTGPFSPKSGTMIAGAPGQPSKVTATKVGSGSLRVNFTVPGNNGATITSIAASCRSSNGGISGSRAGKASPLTVTGLTPAKTYRCTVTATNSRGTGPASSPSPAVTA